MSSEVPCVFMRGGSVGSGAGWGGGSGGDNMVMVTSAEITPVKTKATWSGWQRCTSTGEASGAADFYVPFILLFILPNNKIYDMPTMMDILYSVRSPYCAHCDKVLNGVNRGNIAQLSGVHRVLLSLCNAERSKLWNIMWPMWDLFSGITKLP